MKHKMKKVERKRLSDQIIEQILSFIKSGKWKVGDKLPPVEELMKELGVGRSSIREAIGALALIGILSVNPGAGVKVISSANTFYKEPSTLKKPVGQVEVEGIIEARMVIEEAIAEVAVRNATEADISVLSDELAKIDSAIKNGEDIIESDLSFHLAIAKATHNSILIKIVFSELQPFMRTWMEEARIFESANEIDIGMKQHAEILKAIKERDVEKTRLSLRKHLEESSSYLSSVLYKRQRK